MIAKMRVWAEVEADLLAQGLAAAEVVAAAQGHPCRGMPRRDSGVAERTRLSERFDTTVSGIPAPMNRWLTANSGTVCRPC